MSFKEKARPVSSTAAGLWVLIAMIPALAEEPTQESVTRPTHIDSGWSLFSAPHLFSVESLFATPGLKVFEVSTRGTVRRSIEVQKNDAWGPAEAEKDYWVYAPSPLEVTQDSSANQTGEPTFLKQRVVFEAQRFAQDAINRILGDLSGNTAKAEQERDAHERSEALSFSEGSGEAHFYGQRFSPEISNVRYLVEYRLGAPFPDSEETERGRLEDAAYLAQFERVWAYTLGIAVAQASRDDTPQGHERAQAMARYLCAHAVLNPAQTDELQGWHFSWNTDRDSWRDARLVTGASAWAIHGLGQFLASRAFERLEADRDWFMNCYTMSLRGLLRHRRAVPLADGSEAYLMSAGSTVDGLKHAQEPHLLGLSQNPEHRLAYYTVLDAVGYDRYDSTSPPRIQQCALGRACDNHSPHDSTVWRWIDLSETAWKRLHEPTEALNIVTEHNLDTLSVLNHALTHHDDLGLFKTQDLNARALRAWRDKLRAGIFQLLWDETGWTTEFRSSIALDPSSPLSQRMQRALDAHEPLGRFITGGGNLTLLTNETRTPPTRYRFAHKSQHAAIDNCSWLALSVDYKDPGFSAETLSGLSHADKLERCLRYTIIRFIKPLCTRDSGGDCEAAESTHLGAHYFQDDFRDPYIRPSHLQSASYHLEATMGLILGLLYFTEAYPERPYAASMRQTAHDLWVDAQAFVDKFGFPYSSQRIYNLSTRLSSATAIVWFLDVHDHLGSSSSHDATEVSKVGLPLKSVFRSPSKGFFAAFKELMKMDPAAASTAVSWMLPATVLLGDLDAGLTTMVTFDIDPGPAWTRVGTIDADQIIQELAFGEHRSGVVLYYNDETEIRTKKRYRSSGIAQPFDVDKIYGFDTRHLQNLIPTGLGSPQDSLVGDLAFDSPKLVGDEGQVDVYALATTTPRDMITDAFFRHHLWWQHVLSIAEHIPNDGVRDMLLTTMRGLFLGWFFDASTAERSAGLPQSSPNGKPPAWWQDIVGYSALGEKDPSSNPDDHIRSGAQWPFPWFKELKEQPPRERPLNTAGVASTIELPFTQDPKTQWMLVSLDVDRIQTLRLIFDTGAPATLITPDALDKLQKTDNYESTRWTIETNDAHSSEQNISPIVQLKNVTLGRATFGRFPVAVSDLISLQTSRSEIDGILGSDFFHRYIVEIDLARQVIRLHPENEYSPHPDDGDPVSFVSAGGHIRLTATLPGLPSIPTILDLGSTFSQVTTSAAGQMVARDTNLIRSNGDELPARMPEYVRIGTTVFKEPTLVVQWVPFVWAWNGGLSPAMILGQHTLAGRRIVINYRTQEIFFGPPKP